MEPSLFVVTAKSSKNLRKLKQRVRVKSNHVLFLLMITFLFLYVRDHARLIEAEEALEELEFEEGPEDHWPGVSILRLIGRTLLIKNSHF